MHPRRDLRGVHNGLRGRTAEHLHLGVPLPPSCRRCRPFLAYTFLTTTRYWVREVYSSSVSPKGIRLVPPDHAPLAHPALLFLVGRTLRRFLVKILPPRFPPPGRGRARVGVKGRCRARVDAPRLSPPSQPFPATASAEGRQFNGAPSPARGEGEQEGYAF